MMFTQPIIQNDLFEGIMGRNEFIAYQETLSLDKRKDLVLISISEPGDEFHNPVCTVGFYDVLQIQFHDIEYSIGGLDPISWEQGKTIRDFILKNKDKRFLIHCRAGMSRSAGVGKAVECLIKHNGNVYNYMTSKSNISDYERYIPNRCVFDRICKEEQEQQEDLYFD